MAEEEATEAEIKALQEQHAETLAQISSKGTELRERKEAGAEKGEIKELAAALDALKLSLPVPLMDEGTRKKWKKAEAKRIKDAEKAARAAQWAPKNPDKKKKKKEAKPEEKRDVPETPHGDKKVFGEMANAYHPLEVERAWDAWWEKSGFYTTDAAAAAEAKPEDKFVIVIPPPNVTGSLHIGHALTCSIEDTLCRWHRMCGRHVMWMPGTDHAGIATQAVVEKRLAKERGLTKHDLGREKFLDEIWKWKNDKGAHILTQLRRLGASVDHSRTVFTMDEERSKCVTEAFVRMFEAGLIYRDTRLVNWSSALNTALSDIEVEHEEIKGVTLRHVKGHDPEKKYEFGTLTSFAYKVADESGAATEEEIVVATTRLETMLGDTAVAIHPEDPRHKHLHGRRVVHPFRGDTIPIILDEELVDMEKGTGAVKITPAHDPKDFQCGRRHNLPELSVLNDNGSMNDICPQFANMMRFDARIAIEEELTKLGLFRDKQPNEMTIPICQRSGDVIEPRLVPQWWVSCETMAKRAVEVVEQGELKLVPEFHKKTWFQWLRNIQDWCISRQLWWGHRIPAFRVAGTDEWFVGRDEAEARQKAAEKLGKPADELELEQDPDVLDTWFSSGLFPFSGFGWGREGADAEQELKAFYPGTLLETGHDIIFFWVARMVMMSLQLNDKLPFETVYLHAMVRDKYGRKMSKSLGNVLDPIQVMEGVTLEELHKTLLAGNLPEKEIAKALEGQKMDYPEGIPECGADALRFGLLAFTVQGRDVNLDINRVAAYRRFCNKLWQVTKFVIGNIGDHKPDPLFLRRVAAGEVAVAMRDRWILSRLSALATECNRAMENFEFASATQALYTFYLEELCDVYVEAVKPIMRGEDAASKALAQDTLWHCLDISLRLMHPIMPFVTEELWQRLPSRPEGGKVSVMISHYPGATPVGKSVADEDAIAETAAIRAIANPDAEAYLSLVNLVAHGMRSLATDFGLGQSRKLVFSVLTSDAAKQAQLEQAVSDLEVLGRAKQLTVLPMDGAAPAGWAAGLPDPTIQVFLELEGIVEPAKELEKLGKNLDKATEAIAKLVSKRDGGTFDKMKPAAQEKLLADLESEETKKATLEKQIEMFRSLA